MRDTIQRATVAVAAALVIGGLTTVPAHGADKAVRPAIKCRVYFQAGPSCLVRPVVTKRPPVKAAR